MRTTRLRCDAQYSMDSVGVSQCSVAGDGQLSRSQVTTNGTGVRAIGHIHKLSCTVPQDTTTEGDLDDETHQRNQYRLILRTSTVWKARNNATCQCKSQKREVGTARIRRQEQGGSKEQRGFLCTARAEQRNMAFGLGRSTKKTELT